jgi:hypothetical protein
MTLAGRPPFAATELPFASIGGRVRRGPAAPVIRHGDPLGTPVETGDRAGGIEITSQDVDRILNIDADLVRVRSVAFGYHCLSAQVAQALGLEDLANWWTFATWASVTMAWSIDPEHGWQPRDGDLRVPSPLRRLARSHKLTVSNQLLAQANRYVFAEMATLALAIEANRDKVLLPSSKDRDEFERDLHSFAHSVEPVLQMDLFGPGRPELLRHGVVALFQAARADDPARRSGLVHVSNLALFEYEQRRLQRCLEVLISARPLRRWIEVRDLTPGPAGPLASRLAEVRSRLYTHFMKMQLPHREVSMAGLDQPTGEAPVVDVADAVYLARWAKRGRGQGSRRRNRRLGPDWTHLAWRMARMNDLFWEERANVRLHECPFDPSQVDQIRRGHDPRNDYGPPIDRVEAVDSDQEWDHEVLDRLRHRGDRASCRDGDAGHLVDGSTPAWPEAIDRWVEHHPHLELHEMLRVLNAHEQPPAESVHGAIRSQLLDTPADRLSWLEPAQTADAFRSAREFFRAHLPAIGAALVYGSLPVDIAAADGALVLYQTGYFLKDAPGRIDRTTQFVLEAMNTGVGSSRVDGRGAHVLSEDEEADPLGDPYGPALRAIRRTRITHQLVRSWIGVQSTGGALDAWSPHADPGSVNGRPINVEDEIGTILSFTTALWDALANLGVDPDALAEHEEPWYLTWCTIGLNLGMPEEVLPRSAADARRLMWLLAWRHLRPSQAGFELGRTLIREAREVLPSPLDRLARPVASRFASSAIRATTAPPVNAPYEEHPWSVAEMLALPRSIVITPRVAKALLRMGIGEGSLGLPRDMMIPWILSRHPNVGR